jgi:uncharacterized protein (TIGR00730 family)
VDTSSSPAEVPAAAVAAAPAAVEVAVIGSARIDPGDPRHDAAIRLGAALAAEGWTVMTGGYGGLMGATAEGAVSNGGHTVGLPMRAWEHLTPHPGNTELRWSDDYSERMRHLLQADVVVALPGGVGTLAEASAVWAAVQTEPGSAALVVVGAGWGRLLEAFAADLVIDPDDVALAHQVPAVEDVAAMVRILLERPDQALSARG